VWDVQTQERQGGPFEDHNAALLTMLFDPNDDTLISFGSDGSRVSRKVGSEAIRREEPPVEGLALRSFSVGGNEPRAVASEASAVSEPTRVLLWDRPFDLERAPRIWTRRDAVRSLALHPTDGSVVIGGLGGRIERWRPPAEDTESLWEKSAVYAISVLALSPNGRWLASDTDGGVIVWDLSTRQRLFEERRGSKDEPVAFSRDSQTLILGPRNIGLDLALWLKRACALVNRNLTWAEWDLYLGHLEYRPICDHVDLDANELLQYVNALAARGQRERIAPLLERASELAVDRGDETNDNICRTAGLLALGSRVMAACDRAVAGCRAASVCARYRDHRAVARAQAGEFRDAAEDLKVQIASLEATNPTASHNEIERRNTWIRELASDRNPFDDEALTALRLE
jgi:hypothetical protein